MSGSSLYSAFPTAVASELKTSGSVQPRYQGLATILLADLKDSILLTEGMEPARLIEQLDNHFATVDDVAAVDRVSTVRAGGDGALCAAGVPEETRTRAYDMCLGALQVERAITEKNRQCEMLRLKSRQLRIGRNTGSVMAGALGAKRYTYGVRGASMNSAARLEQACGRDRINTSSSTFHYVEDLFEAESRGRTETKNLGESDLYFLNRIKPERSSDAHGIRADENFW